MELNYRKIDGGNENLIILHGLLGTLDNWISIARKLSSRYTVYLIDLRNHGRSPHSNEHTYDLMCDDILDFAEKKKLISFSLLGHSMGGKVSMLFARDYPEMIENLIIVDIAPYNYNTSKHNSLAKHIYLFETLLQIDLNTQERNFIYKQLLKHDIEESVCQFVMKNLQRDIASDCFSWKPNLKVLYKNLVRLAEDVNENDFIDRMPILKYPVYFFKGGLSKYIGSDQIDVIREIYPQSKIVNFENATHWVHVDQYQKLLDELLTLPK